MTTTANMDVSFVTFHDDAFPVSNLLDGNPNTFILTTGSFPQEVTLAMRAASVNVSRITLVLQEAKDIVVEKCVEDSGTRFEVIAERTLSQGPDAQARRQTVALDLDPTAAGKQLKAVKLKILSGFSEFVALYSIEVKGEETQQRIAVMESKPEVSM